MPPFLNRLEQAKRINLGLFSWNKPTAIRPGAEMHFHNTDKLDLTAIHGQQWVRAINAAVSPTLQQGPTKAAMCV